VKLSNLLILLGLLLALTTRSWSQWWDRRTLSQLYQDIKSGKQPPSTPYAKVAMPVSIVLIIAGTYLAFVGR